MTNAVKCYIFSVCDFIDDINGINNNINNITNDISDHDKQLCYKPDSLLVKIHKMHRVLIEKKLFQGQKVLILCLHEWWSTFLNALAGKYFDFSGGI